MGSPVSLGAGDIVIVPPVFNARNVKGSDRARRLRAEFEADIAHDRCADWDAADSGAEWTDRALDAEYQMRLSYLGRRGLSAADAHVEDSGGAVDPGLFTPRGAQARPDPFPPRKARPSCENHIKFTPEYEEPEPPMREITLFQLALAGGVFHGDLAVDGFDWAKDFVDEDILHELFQ